MPLPSRFRIPPTVLSRTVGTETILFDLQSSSYHSLNEVGGRFWKLIQEDKDVEQILFTLVEEFEVDRPKLEEDISSLASQLQSLGLVQPVEEGV